MDLLLILLVILLFVGAPLGWSTGGPMIGGGIGLILVIILVFYVISRR